MDPAYDVTDPRHAARSLTRATGANYPPAGDEWRWVQLLASLSQFTGPDPDPAHQITTAEATASLTLIHVLRHWLTELEPDFIDTARRAGAT
jgi:hypothetical protein